MYYWSKKNALKRKAKDHTNEMTARFAGAIANSIGGTEIYGEEAKTPHRGHPLYTPRVSFINTDTVSALFEQHNEGDRIAVLNFASYKNPGGMFLNGSSAQEEMLCHESFLYNVLSTQQAYYAWNNKNKNHALYLNRALYSPDVLFVRDEQKKGADVITCAAPNFSASKYQGVSSEQNLLVLDRRIAFVRNVAEDRGVDVLILGAFGCGVFGQNPVHVASVCKNVFAQTSIGQIVYAVPGQDANAKVFREVFV